MKSISSHGGHSADVRMQLRLHGSSFTVVQLGPDFLFLGETTDLPPGEGTLMLGVDGSERCWRVRLPDGISAVSKRVIVAKAA